MVGWHHRLNRHELKQTPRDGEGQGSLECCGPWVHGLVFVVHAVHKESEMTS